MKLNKKLFLLPLVACFLALASCNNKPVEQSNDVNSQINQSSENNAQSSNNKTSTSTLDTYVAVTGVSLNYDALSLYVGKSTTLQANIEPYNASNPTVKWSSSNTSVATITDKGVLTTVSEGETTITVTTVEGNFTASLKLTVLEKEESATYVPDTTNSKIYFITNDTLSSGTYDATNAEYTFTVKGSYEQIYVNAPDKVIVIELNNATIQNSLNSPIYVADCDKVEISAKKETTNNVKDNRPILVEEEADQGKGAIYVDNGDLKLKGTGTLNITSTYFNGIHCKDDVKIQKQTLNVNAVNHGIRGNDSITVTSGTINISCGGDGLHTENSDVSSKGNQKGNVTINGGTLTINSWSDAIQASYNAVIEQTDSAVPLSIVAKTNKYSSYSGETVDVSNSSFYLKMNSSTYANGGYTYAALINGQWYKANYKGTQSTGGGPGGPGGGPGGFGGPGGGPGSSSTYYFYELAKPNGATSFTLYRFQGNNVSTFSETEYNAKADAKAFNSAYDTVQISVNGSNINFGSWSNYSSGNSNSADVSAKGIKAENEIYVKSGTINIKSYDDAIHANNDGTLENGDAPLGNVKISGGDLTLNASDDGIHADYTLEISGGKTNVESAYEGLEGNLINISGGETYVYATDDGVNATKGKVTPAITVSGGYLDVAVPANGDTDGIDSNGSFTQKGGVVIIKGPGSAGGGSFGAAALDTDGTVSLSDGTLVVFGGIEKTPSTSLTKTLCSSNSVSTGEHTVSFTDGTAYKTTLKTSTNGCVVYSVLGKATLQ